MMSNLCYENERSWPDLCSKNIALGMKIHFDTILFRSPSNKYRLLLEPFLFYSRKYSFDLEFLFVIQVKILFL